MIKSMTGFARRVYLDSKNQISVELKSSNHKFLEVIVYLPEGCWAWEPKIKKQIQKVIKRGRVLCNINILSEDLKKVVINEELLKEYFRLFKKFKKEFLIKKDLTFGELINLPGVLNLSSQNYSCKIWQKVYRLLKLALEDLEAYRIKEGKALSKALISKIENFQEILEQIKIDFKKILATKLSQLNTEEEKTLLLKSLDISEELDRLDFHLKNFKESLFKLGGKELDFIVQEIQRETNTLGAKSPDPFISEKIIKLKAETESLREQLQNVE